MNLEGGGELAAGEGDTGTAGKRAKLKWCCLLVGCIEWMGFRGDTDIQRRNTQESKARVTNRKQRSRTQDARQANI